MSALRSLIILIRYSIAHFQRLLHEDREVHQDDPRGIEVTIRRKYILEDSLRHLRNINLRKVRTAR